MQPSRDTPPVPPGPHRTAHRRVAVAVAALGVLTPLAACSKGNDQATTTTTAKVLETISTVATSTTDDPTNPKSTTTRPPTTTAPTTAAPATVNGTMTIKPSSVSSTYEYDTTGNAGTTPVLAWDVKLDAGQKVSVHGPAPGTPDAELSTVAAGSFPLCPGSLVGTTCTVEAKSYTYTIDVKNPDGSVAATKTASFRASS